MAGMVKLEVSYFARDIDALAAFYTKLFDVKTIDAVASPIYRAVDFYGTRLGIHDFKAYDLLEISGRQMKGAIPKPVGTYITCNVDSKEELDTRLARALQLGARVLKAPYISYYNAYQVVLADPEDNMFRINYQM
ncbi:MAG TPA: VOC family protein [Burkholderiales bacterium]|nr:VOC family protein [Burkholderiales bacterium]